MPKLLWMQFYPGDWLADTGPLSPHARGIWIDACCALWRSETRGTLTLTLENWAKLFRCSIDDVDRALGEFRAFSVCDLVINRDTLSQPCHAHVTLTSRRMIKEEKARELAKLRKQRERGKKPVTPASRSSHKEKLETRSYKKKEEEEERKEKLTVKEKKSDPPAPADQTQLAIVTDARPTWWEKFWNVFPDRNGKKLEKTATLAIFQRLSQDDQQLVVAAATNYANSDQVKRGIGIRDPKRFLQNGSGHAYWRDWITPESTPAPAGKETVMQKRLRSAMGDKP